MTIQYHYKNIGNVIFLYKVFTLFQINFFLFRSTYKSQGKENEYWFKQNQAL